MIVRDTVSMLLGEEHRPLPMVRDDDNTNDWILAFIEDTRIWWHLTNAATIGSDGAVAWVTRVLAANGPGKPGRFFHEMWPAVECTPVFKREAPDQLESITRVYFVSEDSLRSNGYDVDALKKKWDKGDGRTRAAKAFAVAINRGIANEWVLRCKLDAIEEAWNEPVPRYIFEDGDFETKIPWPPDTERTVNHKLKEVPALWIVNGPTDQELHPDGPCTFEPAINFQFRIDRTLSQTGRAFDYTGDPQFARSHGKGGAGGAFGEDEGGDMDATATGIVETDEKGGAWFVEISGEGLKIALDTYVKLLRQIAREVAGGSRIDPEASPRELSGVAMKMLNAALIWTTSLGRQAYGELGLIPVLKLGMRINEAVLVELPTLKARLDRREADSKRRAQTKKVMAAATDVLADPTLQAQSDDDNDETGPDAETFDGEPNADAYIELSWPQYYEPDGADFQAQVAGIVGAVQGQVISSETGIANAAALFDVRDSEKEGDRIRDDQSLVRARTATDAKLQAQNEPGQASGNKG